MNSAGPSRTALAAAGHRAAHQVLEQRRIFADPLALRILGDDAERIVADAREDPSSRTMRVFIAVRSRFAEDAMARAIAGGLRQVVVLGAGLDTFAYRRPPGGRVRVFEVDHPATQAWKRERLAEAGITLPESLAFAPVDFEQDELPAALRSAGFDEAQSAFFTCLGVVPYVREPAVWSTLEYIAGLPAGAQVVFDYSDPPESRSSEQHAEYEARAARVALIGEPWITHFEPALLHARLRAIGFTEIEDLGPSAIAARYFPGRGSTRERGGHVLHAISGAPTS